MLQLLLCCWIAVTAAVRTPIRSLTVTLRGQPYEIEDVTTVGELRAQLAQQTGESSTTTASSVPRIKLLLAGGQRLPDDPNAVLADIGVPTTGAQLSAVPSSSSSSSGKKKKSTTLARQPTASASTAGAAAASNPMKDYLQQSGIDTSQLDEMMKGLGGGSDEQPSIQDSMKAMTDAMNSPLFQEMMNDPEKLEQSRQMILNNPMLKSMMGGMPGMDDLLNDKDAWREAMQAAAEIYKSMDSDQLMKIMMSGMSGGMPPGMDFGGMGGGGFGAGANLFDGTLDDSSTATAALDELDEDE